MKLNEVTKVTTMNANDYVVLNTADGKIVQIKKSDLANALTDVMRIATTERAGLMNYNGLFYAGSLAGNNLTDVKSSFGYAYGTLDGSGIAGPFLSLKCDSCFFQLKAEYRGTVLKWRTFNHVSQTWSEWKTLSDT